MSEHKRKIRDRVQEISNRLAQATPGDWDVGRHPSMSTHIRAYVDDGFSAYLTVCERVDDSAEFIAHAPDDIRWLLERIEELDDRVEQLMLLVAT